MKFEQPFEITTTSSYTFEKIYSDIVDPLPKGQRTPANDGLEDIKLIKI